MHDSSSFSYRKSPPLCVPQDANSFAGALTKRKSNHYIMSRGISTHVHEAGQVFALCSSTQPKAKRLRTYISEETR